MSDHSGCLVGWLLPGSMVAGGRGLVIGGMFAQVPSRDNAIRPLLSASPPALSFTTPHPPHQQIRRIIHPNLSYSNPWAISKDSIDLDILFSIDVLDAPLMTSTL
ncbi:uncharacterized protein H6S33_005903 [Morchella sextelata]|uniref:uncharacterized protein n=1 Tax=Morchella sextelata TaxID=1174677 RepID=UPI001D049052|nr:uncharacterized protein H6S33_005903 [Morchella sextelata]KAH0614017.1 hypothetical protein H6S33_005903 [Morchella sextelata]